MKVEKVEESDSEDSDSEMNDEEDLSEDDANFKPVDRLKKLSVNQRNQKKARKERNQAQLDKAHERKMAKQYD